MVLCTTLLAVQAWAGLDTMQTEPNLEKRAHDALDNARSALKAAKEAYLDKGDLRQTRVSLNELERSVQLAYDSLTQTRKNPSQSPKHFKRAEITTRELLRQLEDFREQMAVDDRAEVDKTRAAIQKVHESLLEGIMGGKKK
jgi:hypothetical protein